MHGSGRVKAAVALAEVQSKAATLLVAVVVHTERRGAEH